ncbi:MAG: magnesium chelatase subunit H [Candidatus Roseilinea sp.]|nr:MAG: magnesium chelatase subunit H [Candidatus Roseilinea sp.]
MSDKPNIVAIVGLEHFNKRVWDEVKADLAGEANLAQFTEWELESHATEAARAIRDADCLFVSMINFKDQADWLREQVEQSRASVVFAYESMPEVMALNRVGDYVVANRPGSKGGMPEPVKKIARMLVHGRDEDTLYGYTKLMKLMQTMMRFMPAKARDFKNWMQVNIYWNQPLAVNVSSMFKFILREYFNRPVEVPPVVEVPMMGLYHPDAPGFFKDIKAYRDWRKRRGKMTRRQGDKGTGRQGEREIQRSLTINHQSPVTNHQPSVALLFFRKHLMQDRGYIDETIRAMEDAGLDVLPIFVTGVEGHVVVRDWLAKEHVDALVSTIGFALVGGPAGSTSPGAHRDAVIEILARIDAPYIVAQPLYVQDFVSWQKIGVGPMQAAATYALPEMDGAIDPVILGAINNGRFQTAPDRLQRLTTLVTRWAALRRTPNRDKKIAFVVYDYPPGLGKKATAALLDVPRSLLNILRRLQAEGYDVGQLPESPEELLRLLEAATTPDPGGLAVTQEQFKQWTTPRERERVEERWGSWPGDIAPAGRDAVFIGGLRLGNIYIGVQPRFGVTGDPMRLLFDKDNTPHHQYLAFYRWISRGFGAHALIHVGMHGSAEWMPGLQLGMTRSCWPDALLGELPQLYLYPMNNPSEANIAKRRGYAVMVSHAVPPMARAGLYKELAALKDMLQDYRERQIERRGQAEEALEEAMLNKVALANLDADCPRLQGEPFSDYAARLYAYLRDLEQRLITSSLHVFGEAAPTESQIVTVTEALKARGGSRSLAEVMLRETLGTSAPAASYAELAALARRGDPEALRARERVDEACRAFVEHAVFRGESPASALHQATHNGTSVAADDAAALMEMAQAGRMMARMLSDNRAELEAVVRGLGGRYIPPAPGGDLIRDGLNVLPTGRNIHAIDPWRIPSELAYARGAKIAEALLEKHLAENAGQYPETIAQVLWGLDTIKTKGEAIGTVLRLIGARPHHDGQGKISHYELIPLEELGRPRIDVLMNLSPIFRDTFELLMDHLDRLVKAAARANEPVEMNFIKKHVEEAMRDGMTFEQATARLFTQQPGQYGTYVDDMVEDSAWQSQDDLDQLFVRRNAYAYGGGRNGQHAPEVLQRMLGTVGRVAQEIDSVEFGVADIDHYFSSSGALHLAARKRSRAPVKLNYIESYTAETRIDDLDRVLRTEYRTKLLNPRWYEGMLQHGYSGATEISNRFTYMLGWDAVSDCVDDWVYANAAKTYALDPAMRERLTKANPQAMRNIVGRLLEANGRGLWQADDDVIEQLKELYADLEDRLEGVAYK